MFFNKKNDKLVLEMYAEIGELCELFPPERLKKSIPSWFYNIPGDGKKTVKQCPGFIDLHDSGIVVRSWAEYEITVSPHSAQVKAPQYQRGPHSDIHDLNFQAPGAWPGYQNVKLHSPWLFWCNEPIKWMWTQPTWEQNDPAKFIVIPGVSEYKYQNRTNILLLFKSQPTEYKVHIRPGDILAHLVPLTERPVEYKVDVLTPDIYNRKFAKWNHSFDMVYQKTKAIIGRRT